MAAPAPIGTKPAPAAKTREFSYLAAATPKPRIVFYGVEGFGKTTFAAFGPDPLILMARDETGVQRLADSHRIPEKVPAVKIEEWPDLITWLDDLAANARGRKTLALDTLGSFERLCHEFVCKRDFNGDWGERGFASFQKGYDVSTAEWLKMLGRLEKLNKQGMTIILLGHARIKTFKNPTGADFDRYVCDVHDKTWAMTARWADCVYFGNFLAVVDSSNNKKKGKGIGGTERVVYTNRRDAWDAKPGYGVPEIIDIPADHTKVYETIFNAINSKE